MENLRHWKLNFLHQKIQLWKILFFIEFMRILWEFMRLKKICKKHSKIILNYLKVYFYEKDCFLRNKCKMYDNYKIHIESEIKKIYWHKRIYLFSVIFFWKLLQNTFYTNFNLLFQYLKLIIAWSPETFRKQINIKKILTWIRVYLCTKIRYSAKFFYTNGRLFANVISAAMEAAPFRRAMGNPLLNFSPIN